MEYQLFGGLIILSCARRGGPFSTYTHSSWCLERKLGVVVTLYTLDDSITGSFGKKRSRSLGFVCLIHSQGISFY